ncbi:MAG TPA: hypothetical protein VJ715_05630 [Pyrinomonadaceae bacterium]|nr:hypothetical protein [Pyrinomonadaceae bacterium]
MVSGELEKSLRDAVDEYINSRLGGLQQEITRLQSQVNEAFTQLAERAGGEADPDHSVAASISEHIRAAHERGIEEAAAESARTRASSDLAILKAGIEDLSEQHSQSEILSTLVNRAASFAPRVAFFVVKNEQAIGWRARGLEGSVGDDAVRELVLPLSADTPLSDVVRSRNTWSGAPGSNAEDYLLLNHLGSDPPQRMVAIPLIARGRAAAVLYADSAALDADAINLEALETLVRVAGMAVELLVGGGGARPAAAAAPAQQPQPAAAAAVPETQPETAPPPPPEEAAAPEPEAQSEAAPPQAEPAWATGEGEETPTVVVEAPPAEEAEAQPAYAEPAEYTGEETIVAEAPPQADDYSHLGATVMDETTAEVEQPQAPAPEQYTAPAASGGTAARGWRSADAADLPVEVGSDEERQQHNYARRFARLLVSEIKLYNEQKVREGRLEGDIYHRLREDIDRSRQMYDQRISQPVTARYDYFHHEVVNTLAEGDPSKLGRDYPGAA